MRIIAKFKFILWNEFLQLNQRINYFIALQLVTIISSRKFPCCRPQKKRMKSSRNMIFGCNP